MHACGYNTGAAAATLALCRQTARHTCPLTAPWSTHQAPSARVCLACCKVEDRLMLACTASLSCGLAYHRQDHVWSCVPGRVLCSLPPHKLGWLAGVDCAKTWLTFTQLGQHSRPSSTQYVRSTTRQHGLLSKPYSFSTPATWRETAAVSVRFESEGMLSASLNAGLSPSRCVTSNAASDV